MGVNRDRTPRAVGPLREPVAAPPPGKNSSVHLRERKKPPPAGFLFVCQPTHRLKVAVQRGAAHRQRRCDGGEGFPVGQHGTSGAGFSWGHDGGPAPSTEAPQKK